MLVPTWGFFTQVLQPAIQKMLNAMGLIPKEHYRWRQKNRTLIFSNGSTVYFATRLTHAMDVSWVYAADIHRLSEDSFRKALYSLSQGAMETQRLFAEANRPLEPGTWQHDVFFKHTLPLDPGTVRVVTGDVRENDTLPEWMRALIDQQAAQDWPEPTYAQPDPTPEMTADTATAESTPLAHRPATGPLASPATHLPPAQDNTPAWLPLESLVPDTLANTPPPKAVKR
jgi:hypothetical protein